MQIAIIIVLAIVTGLGIDRKFFDVSGLWAARRSLTSTNTAATLVAQEEAQLKTVERKLVEASIAASAGILDVDTDRLKSVTGKSRAKARTGLDDAIHEMAVSVAQDASPELRGMKAQQVAVAFDVYGCALSADANASMGAGDVESAKADRDSALTALAKAKNVKRALSGDPDTFFTSVENSIGLNPKRDEEVIDLEVIEIDEDDSPGLDDEGNIIV